jgi:hypothetical protein
MLRRFWTFVAMGALALVIASGVPASVPGGDVRLSNDCLVDPGDPLTDPGALPPACPGGGYVSAWTLAHPDDPVSDDVLDSCSISHRQQNEPAIGVDPRDTRVLIGSANDYCGVDVSDVWLGYYRSEDGGRSFQSSLVPGYPGDATPFAALADVRTSGSGDPVIAWDNEGRVFMGSESSGNPTGTKSWGDVWVARYVNPDGPSGDTLNDGKLYAGTETVAHGSSSPFIIGKFYDKTAIEVDRTGGPCDGTVYFAFSRFAGQASNGFNAQIYLVRSTDHGETWSHPIQLSQTIHDIQFPDIAVTGNGHVYVTYRQWADVRSHESQDAVIYNKSVDCGQTFSRPVVLAPFEPYDAVDVPAPEPIPAPPTTRPLADEESEEAQAPSELGASNCGDFAFHCASGYTFFRRATQVRSTADQLDKAHEWVYVVYDPSKPGTETPSGSTYGTIVSGDLPLQYHQNVGSQSGIYFLRLDGASGSIDLGPMLIDDQPAGHQLFPDISADGGVLHAMWWDSRLDPCYSPARPVGNCADRTTVPSLDVFGTASTDNGATWSPSVRVTDVTSNPNYEQFGNRAFPFAGDYLYITSLGEFAYSVWTDYRDVVQGVDPREPADEEDGATADVKQCREPRTVQVSKKDTITVWSGDLCPHAGGVDQNIYGDTSP